MLTENERKEIEHELANYERRDALCIDALKAVQKHRGWVSDEAINDVAEFLGMTPDEVDGVATFYNLIYRKPVGKHVIHVCDSVSCWIVGYDEIRDRLLKKLGIRYGQTTADGEFTVLTVPCLGCCEKAPALMIDGETISDLTPQRIDELVERHRGRG